MNLGHFPQVLPYFVFQAVFRWEIFEILARNGQHKFKNENNEKKNIHKLQTEQMQN